MATRRCCFWSPSSRVQCRALRGVHLAPQAKTRLQGVCAGCVSDSWVAWLRRSRRAAGTQPPIARSNGGRVSIPGPQQSPLAAVPPSPSPQQRRHRVPVCDNCTTTNGISASKSSRPKSQRVRCLRPCARALCSFSRPARTSQGCYNVLPQARKPRFHPSSDRPWSIVHRPWSVLSVPAIIVSPEMGISV
jgi:hypothetical protein